MKKIINYEKDILFKTNIGEMCSISLEHDFTVDDGYLRGEFLLSGEYKPNEISLNKESFSYRLPLEYELERNVDLATLTYDIENFEYNVREDELSVYIDFGVRYEEKRIEPTIPDITEEELNSIDFGDIEMTKFVEDESDEDEPLTRTSEEIEVLKHDGETKEDEVADRLDEQDKDIIMNTVFEGDEYVTYHVHVVKDGDTLESIAIKYGCTVESIKEYNSTDTIEVKSKLIIPDVKDE